MNEEKEKKLIKHLTECVTKNDYKPEWQGVIECLGDKDIPDRNSWQCPFCGIEIWSRPEIKTKLDGVIEEYIYYPAFQKFRKDFPKTKELLGMIS
jgi:hypothetical protein